MYKDYETKDYINVVDKCADNLRSLLTKRYDELEEFRDAINDRYPWEDLYLRWAEVDDEEHLISMLLEHLDTCAYSMKNHLLSEDKKTTP